MTDVLDRVPGRDVCEERTQIFEGLETVKRLAAKSSNCQLPQVRSPLFN
jgi:hypothetical protein